MQYDAVNGRIQAKRWGVPTSTLARWRRLKTIPDCRALGEPLDKAGRLVEEKLIKLVEAGWVKARPISRLIGSENKVNALLVARRYPGDYRYSVHHLGGHEIKKIKPVLDELQRSAGVLLYLASITPAEQNYNDVIQADLRALLHRENLSTVNIRLGMDTRQVSRFWAFMRGQSASRKDLDFLLNCLEELAKMLVR
jgi:hypothetical protein